MARVHWALRHGRPSVEIVLTLAPNGEPLTRTLLADTGAGSKKAKFELILDEDDCLFCGGLPGTSVTLRGAYNGTFPLYDIAVKVPGLGFTRNVRVVGVPSAPAHFNGIACFNFLNRFHYGNFADPDHFGLES